MLLARLRELVSYGQYVEAWSVYGQVLMDTEIDKAGMAEATLLAAIARYCTDNPYSAVDLGESALRYAEGAGSDVLLGKVWANLCEFYRYVGDTVKAKETAEKWFANARRYPELDDWRGRVHYNLALIKRARREQGYFGEFESACIMLTDVLDKSPAEARSSAASMAVMARQMAAKVCYEVGRIDDGDRHAQLAGVIIDGYCQHDDEAVREQIALKMGRAYQIGEHDKAIALSQEFLTLGAPRTKDQEFWASWYAGMIYTRHPDTLTHAQMIATALRDLCMELKVPMYMNRLCELNQRIHSQQE